MDVKPKSKISKWFSPVVFLFLICACPPIWIMELTIASNVTHVVTMNATAPTVTISSYEPQLLSTTLQSLNFTQATSTFQSILDTNDTNTVPVDQIISLKYNDTSENNSTNVTMSDLERNYSTNYSDSISNNDSEIFTVLPNISTVAPPVNLSTSPDRDIVTKGTDVINKFETIWSKLALQYRTTILEQVLLLTLIICRWLLPRGGITRDQLSQLLLVNIGMAADILELFEALKEDAVRHHLLLNIIILVLWQSSLFQFSLTKTVTKARKIRMGYFEEYSSKSNTELSLSITNCICCRTELWAIATSLLLQDIPFFCLRMTLIVEFNVLSYSNIFFTCKNSLVILLQLFRSYVILSGKNEDNQVDSTVSRQSLVAASVTRWNQIPGNSTGVELNLENRKALFTDPIELGLTGHENKALPEFLPKASPETSISSKEYIPKTNSSNSIPFINNEKNDV